MKITFKPYDKINEIDVLVKDEDLLFSGNGAPAKVWQNYITVDKNVHYLKVFVNEEFAGILCWGIMDKFGWDKNKTYYRSSDIDKLSPDNVLTDVSWLYAIALSDKYKGKDFSHKLMQKYEMDSKKDGAKWLGLHVLSKNNARFLYKSNGFKQILDSCNSLFFIKKI